MIEMMLVFGIVAPVVLAGRTDLIAARAFLPAVTAD
jgi:hypothetical protein